jgi:hypothetical protein
MAHLGKGVQKHILRVLRGNRIDPEELNGELAPIHGSKVNCDNIICPLDRYDRAVVNVLGTNVGNKVWRGHSMRSNELKLSRD